MAETFEINLLGNTPREQWKTTVNIYRMVIKSNIDKMYDAMEARNTDKAIDAGETAFEYCDKFAEDMIGFIDSVFDYIEKKEGVTK